MVKRRGFTLVEILIVIALLGGIASVVLAQMRVNRKRAVDESMVPCEMNEICRAFANLEADCVTTNADKDLIGKYGLEILVEHNSGRGWSFPSSFDPDRARGWRGPYLQAEVRFSVDVSDTDIGQPLKDTGTGIAEIPIICDPHYALGKKAGETAAERTARQQHYYRVLYDSTHHHLAVVYVGADDALDAGTGVVASPTSAAFEDCFTFGGDDVGRPLSSRSSW